MKNSIKYTKSEFFSKIWRINIKKFKPKNDKSRVLMSNHFKNMNLTFYKNRENIDFLA